MKISLTPDSGVPDTLLQYDWDDDVVRIRHAEDGVEVIVEVTRSDVRAIQNLFDGKED